MYFNIIEAVYIEDYKIQLSFSNGKSGMIDLAEYIMEGDIFEGIRALEKFKNFTLEYGTLTWDNGEIDIAPETLYEKATGESIFFDDGNIQKVG